MSEIQGACHCGALRLTFHTERSLDALPWRKCGCEFCRRHGGLYASDPDGKLTVEAMEPGALNRYRFGQKTAEFLLCSRCGVFMAAIAEIDGKLYAVANLAVANPPLPQPTTIPTMDFDGESVEARTERRKRGWIASVEIRNTL